MTRVLRSHCAEEILDIAAQLHGAGVLDFFRSDQHGLRGAARLDDAAGNSPSAAPIAMATSGQLRLGLGRLGAASIASGCQKTATKNGNT
jgi:hypothetical protein